MTDHLENLDEAEYDALLAELQDAGKLEAVPADLVAAAKAAIMWRTMDAELAELTYDSQADDLALAGVRSGEPSRLLTFEAPGLIVEVETLDAGTRRRLVGQLVPAQPGRIEVRHGGGTAEVPVDELGRFTADDVVPGPVSLRCTGAEGSVAVVTDWVVV
ncbi:MAG: hypothetical protein ACRD2W_15055 [Acidimicrobiales bacterium]